MGKEKGETTRTLCPRFAFAISFFFLPTFVCLSSLVFRPPVRVVSTFWHVSTTSDTCFALTDPQPVDYRRRIEHGAPRSIPRRPATKLSHHTLSAREGKKSGSLLIDSIGGPARAVFLGNHDVAPFPFFFSPLSLFACATRTRESCGCLRRFATKTARRILCFFHMGFF